MRLEDSAEFKMVTDLLPECVFPAVCLQWPWAVRVRKLECDQEIQMQLSKRMAE